MATEFTGVGITVATGAYPHPLRSHPVCHDEVFRLILSTRLEFCECALPHSQEAYVFSVQKTDLASDLMTDNEIQFPSKKQSKQTRAPQHLQSSPPAMEQFSVVSNRSHMHVDSLTGTVFRPGFADRSSSLGPNSIPIQVKSTSTATNAPVANQCEPAKRQRSDFDIEERIKLAHCGEAPWITEREWRYRMPSRPKIEQKEWRTPNRSALSKLESVTETDEISYYGVLEAVKEDVASVRLNNMPAETDTSPNPTTGSQSLRSAASWESGASEKLTHAGKSGSYYRNILKKHATVADLRNAVTDLRVRNLPEEAEASNRIERKKLDEEVEAARVARKTQHLDETWEQNKIERVERAKKREQELKEDEARRSSVGSTFDKMLKDMTPEQQHQKKVEKRRSRFSALWDRFSGGSSRGSSPARSERSFWG